MSKTLNLPFTALALAALFSFVTARAATLVSTLPNANIGGVAYADWNIGPTRQSIAVPFYTGSQAATIESVTVAILNGEQYSNFFGPSLGYSVSIYNTYYSGGSGGYDIPFIPVGIFEPIEIPYNYGSGDLDDYVFSSNANGSIFLDADQTYWIVVEDDDNDISPSEYNSYGTSQANGYQTWIPSPGFTTLDSVWTRSTDTRVAYRYSDWPINDWAQTGGTTGRAFALYGTPVPEPSVFTLAGAALVALFLFRCRRTSRIFSYRPTNQTSQST